MSWIVRLWEWSGLGMREFSRIGNTQKSSRSWWYTIVVVFVVTNLQLSGQPLHSSDRENTGYKVGKQHQLQHDAHMEAHWAYHGIEGPDHWAMLSPQSVRRDPINRLSISK